MFLEWGVLSVVRVPVWRAGKFRGIVAIDIARKEEISRHDPP